MTGYNLVNSARAGNLKGPGPKKPRVPNKPANISGANKGRSWADVVGKGGTEPPPQRDKRTGKGVGKGGTTPPLPRNKRSGDFDQASVPLQLEPSCWQGRLVAWKHLCDSLEKGIAPQGQITLAPTMFKAEEMERLAVAHGLKCEFACCFLLKPNEELPTHCTQSLLPFLVKGKLEFRKCGLLHFGKMPELPPGIVSQVAKAPAKRELVPLRVFLPKMLVSEDRWKGVKAHPVSVIDPWKGPLAVHWSYGWTENKVQNWKGQEEIFLSGYIKVEVALVDQFLSLSGQGGLFVDRLAKDQSCRPNVLWQKRGGRSSHEYHSHVLKEAFKQKQPLAFRVGGGDNLGIRLKVGSTLQVRGVWRVMGVPGDWSVEDLSKVLSDAAWNEVELVSPPQSKKQPWLLRATPPVSVTGAFGAIEVEHDVILLQRATQRKPKEALVNKLSSAPAKPLRESLSPVDVPVDSASPGVLHLDEPPGDVAMTQLDDENTQVEDGQGQKREGSPVGRPATKRLHTGPSPATKRVFNDKFDILDAGGGGACG